MSTLTIEQIIDRVVAVEGGYVNHPDDLGGPTIWGITERVARRHGFTGFMQDMSRDAAKAIYLREYVVAPGFHKVHELSPQIAEELVDTGINCGPAVAAIMLQRALNAFNDRARLYPDVPVDGDCGPATISALRAYLAKRGGRAEVVMLRALNGLQAERYIDLSEKRAGNEAFTFGWFSTRVTI